MKTLETVWRSSAQPLLYGPVIAIGLMFSGMMLGFVDAWTMRRLISL